MWREFFKPIMWHSNRKTNYFSTLKWKPLYSPNLSLPSFTTRTVPVWTTVFSFAISWYKIVMQCSLMVYHGIFHLSLGPWFSWYTQSPKGLLDTGKLQVTRWIFCVFHSKTSHVISIYGSVICLRLGGLIARALVFRLSGPGFISLAGEGGGGEHCAVHVFLCNSLYPTLTVSLSPTRYVSK